MGLAMQLPRRLDTAIIFALSVAFVAVCLAAAVVGFLPRPAYGFDFSPRIGEVRAIVPGGSAALARVSAGDRIIDLPHGDGERGFRLASPRWGDRVRVRTHHGVVTVPAIQQPVPLALALASCFTLLSSIAVCLLALLLCVRRPGPMSLGFWLFALGTFVPAIYPLCIRFPAPLSSALIAVVDAVSAFVAGFVLIPFALRFPTGRLPAGLKMFERVVWAACIVIFAGAVVFGNDLNFGGLVDDRTTAWIVAMLAVAPFPIAAGILMHGYVRSPPVDQAKTAWALAGFGGAIAMTIVVWGGYVLYAEAENSVPALVFSATAGAFISLFPLLAIYPIVRYQLFDLGFVVNRAALYSTLTLAAVAALAGINWLAQHFVTERLTFVLQPLAAIAIGVGYLRVREATQRFIERTIFRRRFAAELHFAAMTASFANATSAEALDYALTTEARDTLALRSAAVFRLLDGAFVLVRSAGWETATASIPQAAFGYAHFGDADLHVIDVVSDVLALQLPAPPGEPVAAFALRSGDSLAGFAVYGRHVNGTEIDPEESSLLRGLADAAGAAYRVAALQAELAALRNENAALRTVAR